MSARLNPLLSDLKCTINLGVLSEYSRVLVGLFSVLDVIISIFVVIK